MKPTNKNEDGLVCLIMKQKEATVRANKKNITDSLHKIFNSDQSLTVNIDSIKAANEDKTEVFRISNLILIKIQITRIKQCFSYLFSVAFFYSQKIFFQRLCFMWVKKQIN